MSWLSRLQQGERNHASERRVRALRPALPSISPQRRSSAALTATLFCAFFFASVSAPVAAAPPPQPQPASPILRVGVFAAPPFTFKNQKGEWDGMNIALWKEVARSIGARYEIQEATGVDDLLLGITRGSLDVVVAPVAITAGREEVADFTHIYYTSGLAVAAPKLSESVRMERLLATIFSADIGRVVAIILVLFAIVAALMWIIERRRNTEFDEHPLSGIGGAFWWAGTTFTTVGYGDKVPRSAIGRGLAIVWMLVSVVAVSAFTAAITAKLTAAHFDTVRTVDQLKDHEVGAVEGSLADVYLRRRNLSVRTYDDIDAAIAAVSRGECDAVVHDVDALRSAVRSARGVTVLPDILEPVDYAFVVPQDSPNREAINRALLQIIPQPFWSDTKTRYGAN